MCASCYSKHGKGIGYGIGQVYLKQDNGKWLKVGGVAPDSNTYHYQLIGRLFD